jgi:polysaccharide export outer membrane protein
VGCFFAVSVASGGCGGSKPSALPAFTSQAPKTEQYVPEIDEYRVLVNDTLHLTVLGSPEISGPLLVLPDGTVSVPGMQPLYVLGKSIREINEEINEALSEFLRFTHATVAVTQLGERRVYLMGEIEIPGDHQYQRGMTVLGAIAQAGGFNSRAKRSSVLILRRLGAEEAVAFRVDLTDPMKGRNLEKDLPVRPFDIVYVPKTFISSLNVFMDQYFRQLTPPFSLYIEGWQAFHLDDETVRFVNP